MPSDAEDLIQGWLRARLEEATGCNAWPLVGPVSAPPYVMFAQSGQQDEDTLAADDETLTTATFTIEVYGSGYAEAHGMARDIRRALRNFTGSSGDLTIARVLVTDSQDLDPIFEDGQNRPIAYAVQVTVTVSWME